MESQTLGKEAFSALVEQHQAAFYRTARSILRNEQDVADAVQEAICLGYAARSNLRDPQRWKAWMLRILVNVCYTTDALGGGLKAAGADADYREPVLL